MFKKSTGMTKRWLSIALAAAMVVTATPYTGLTVSAQEITAEEQDTDMADFESLEEEAGEQGAAGEAQQDGSNTEQEDNLDEDAPAEAEDSADAQDNDAEDEQSGLNDNSDTDEQGSVDETGNNVNDDDNNDNDNEIETDDYAEKGDSEVEAEEESPGESEDALMAADSDGFTVENGKLTAYSGEGGDIVIPEGVVTIAANVFKGNDKITSVILSSSVTTIEESAFANCTGISSLELNDGLKTIGISAFKGIFSGVKTNGEPQYATLDIPGSVEKIYGGAFENCKYLEEVNFSKDGEASKLEFADTGQGTKDVFKGCENLRTVVLPDRLSVIGWNAFENCKKLESVTFGNKVEEIEKFAFNNCSSLDGVTLPDTVTDIGESAFADCAKLSDLKLNVGLQTIGVNAFKGTFSGTQANGEPKYATLDIPGSVQKIYGNAFENCKYLEEVNFSKDDEAYALEFVYSGRGTKAVFKGCENLKTVVLPNRLSVIGCNTFENCTKLESVTFGNNVTTIEDYAFFHCKSLKNIKLPDTLQTIGSDAFNGAFSDEEKSLTIPDDVRSIKSDAFANNENLETVIFKNAENDPSKAAVLELGSSVIGAFGYDSALKKVILPKRLGNIPFNTFYRCTALEAVYIPGEKTTLDKEAIPYNKNLIIYGVKGSPAETYAKDNGITFKDINELDTSVKEITVTPANISLSGRKEDVVGKTIQLTATVKPDIAQNTAVNYTSSDEKVATVNADGLVTIKGFGEADITVTSVENSDVKAVCPVLVREIIMDAADNINLSELEESNIKITGIKANVVYNGTAYRPAVKVLVRKGKTWVTLVENKDFYVEYEHNTDAGEAKVNIQGITNDSDKSGYSGTVSRTFQIKPKSVKKAKVIAGALAGDYNTASAMPIVLYDGTRLLTLNKDYEYAEKIPDVRGKTLTVKIKGKGNYDANTITKAKVTLLSGNNVDTANALVSTDVKLEKDGIEGADYKDDILAVPYTGRAIKPTVTVTKDGKTLELRKEYVVQYKNNKDAGIAYAIVTGKGAYKKNKVIVPFEITPVADTTKLVVTNAAAISKKTYTYSGKLITPSVKVKVDKKTLKKNRDYVVTYLKNFDAGEATIQVTGIGNYDGCQADSPVKFTINPQKISKAAVSVTQNDGKLSVGLTYAKRQLSPQDDYEVVSIEPLTSNKVKLTIKGKGNFTGEITNKTVKIKVGK